jgi:glycosyltransferase involved in cell wall biosynthesis
MFIVSGGGIDTLNRQRCHALAKRGFDCHCLYFYPGSGMQNALAEGVPTFIAKEPSEIMGIVNQYNYEAIVVITAYLEVRMLRIMGYQGKIIYEIQGLGTKDAARHEMTHGHAHIAAHANAILIPKTTHILELCNEMMPHIRKFSFNNPIDTSSFTYCQLPKKNFPILAWFGRMEYNKNWRDFLLIGGNLTRHYPNMQLWMFEDPSLAQLGEREAFEQLTADLELQNHLVLRSNVPHSQMSGYFSMIGDSGGLLCAPSKAEGAPYAVIEAMSCRCPVLTTDSDGVRSAIIHNVTGKYFEHGDIDGAVREALELMRNQELRERICHQAQKHVEENFTVEEYCQNFVSMLMEVGAL